MSNDVHQASYFWSNQTSLISEYPLIEQLFLNGLRLSFVSYTSLKISLTKLRRWWSFHTNSKFFDGLQHLLDLERGKSGVLKAFRLHKTIFIMLHDIFPCFLLVFRIYDSLFCFNKPCQLLWSSSRIVTHGSLVLMEPNMVLWVWDDTSSSSFQHAHHPLKLVY